MTLSTKIATPSKRGGKRFWILLAVTVTGIVLAANVHLLYVALASQPDCFETSKSLDSGPREYRAAKPAC